MQTLPAPFLGLRVWTYLQSPCGKSAYNIDMKFLSSPKIYPLYGLGPCQGSHIVNKSPGFLLQI